MRMRYPSPLMLAGIALLLGMNNAIAQATSDEARCAARDLEVVIVIEDRGAANDVAAEQLAKAGLAQLDARAVCFKGRVTEGVALYDEIISSLGATRVGSAQ